MTHTLPKISPAGLYSQTEAAALLKVHTDSIRRYAKAGTLPFKIRKVNGRPMYKGSDLIKIFYTHN